MDADAPDPICPLCGRPIPPGVPQSLHHLVPRLKGGKGGPTVRLHQICHDTIHATLSEAELARDYNTPVALRSHPALAKFAAWVARRPPGFRARARPAASAMSRPRAPRGFLDGAGAPQATAESSGAAGCRRDDRPARQISGRAP